MTSGLKDYDKSIKVIRNAVKYVRSSPSRLNKFKQCIEDEKISVGGSACLDVPTRWNSTFLMLESAIKYRKAFERMEDDSQYFGYFIVDSSLGNEKANQNESRIGPPCSRDWDEAENFMMFLELFFVGELGKVNPLLFVAVVLDPRYKKQYVDWSFEEMYGINDVSNKMENRVTKCLKNLFEHYSAQDPDCAKEKSLPLKTKTKGDEGGKSELDKYLKDQRESMDGDFDL
ncbi:zinc finger BED domain-containing protein RICESLEEPER 2-like [Rutidosis leptorrhynchoides]|uniref:zinc finger BED domain-containing protein RICESLEEPER 2-like n=1 Tax=Rutidosis leptorrhynchoides TaxID=125765 RepID=UPI003A98FDB8